MSGFDSIHQWLCIFRSDERRLKHFLSIKHRWRKILLTLEATRIHSSVDFASPCIARIMKKTWSMVQTVRRSNRCIRNAWPLYETSGNLHRSTPPHGAIAPSGLWLPHYRGLTITLRHTTLCMTPLDRWSARRRDLYLATHNAHKRQTSMHRRDSNPQSQQASGRKPMP